MGLDDGDDAAVVRIDATTAVVSTVDFFTPVVDDAYDFGRIAAANALSDVYAMGGRPLMALNLVGWPRDVLPPEVLTRGAARWSGHRARRPVAMSAAGTASTTRNPSTAWPSPGLVDPDRCCCATTPLSGGPAHHVDQAAGRRRAEQPAQVAPARCSRTRSQSMTTLNRRRVGRCGREPARSGGHGRHRLRIARPSLQARSRVERSPPSSTPPPCPTSTVRATRCATGSSAAAPSRNLDWVRPHLSTRPSPRTNCYCSPTRKPAADCCVIGEVPGYPGDR